APLGRAARAARRHAAVGRGLRHAAGQADPRAYLPDPRALAGTVTGRRSFLLMLGAGALAAPRSVFARPTRIGLLYFRSRQYTLDTGRCEAFVDGMRELGYVEGKNLAIEARFADGSSERVPALANELVGLKVDVIVAGGGSVYRALHHATKTIPVVAMAVP